MSRLDKWALMAHPSLLPTPTIPQQKSSRKKLRGSFSPASPGAQKCENRRNEAGMCMKTKDRLRWQSKRSRNVIDNKALILFSWYLIESRVVNSCINPAFVSERKRADLRPQKALPCQSPKESNRPTSDRGAWEAGIRDRPATGSAPMSRLDKGLIMLR